MLEEKSSKLESANVELQRRAEKVERSIADNYQQEIMRIEEELIKNRLENERHETEIRNARQTIQAKEETERKLQTQNRTLTDSVKKMQVQMEETKNLVNLLQNERKDMDVENNTLRTELHERLTNVSLNSSMDTSISGPRQPRLPSSRSGSPILRQLPSSMNTSVQKLTAPPTTTIGSLSTPPGMMNSRFRQRKGDSQTEDILLKTQQAHDKVQHMKSFSEKIRQTLNT
jgi:chromosome segregation ATPase